MKANSSFLEIGLIWGVGVGGEWTAHNWAVPYEVTGRVFMSEPFVIAKSNTGCKIFLIFFSKNRKESNSKTETLIYELALSPLLVGKRIYQF